MPITDDVPLPRGSAVIGEHNGYAIYRWTADDVRAYGDARAAAAVPTGYALVPIEPTPGMLDAGDVARHSVVTQARTSVIYRAMIAAAGDKP